jgi:hypothetical protein
MTDKNRVGLLDGEVGGGSRTAALLEFEAPQEVE